jgi:isopenicillin-N N-acyltransferase like protein
MPRPRRIARNLLYALAALLILLLIGYAYLYSVAIAHPPAEPGTASLALKRKMLSPTAFAINDNWFRKSKTGLYEMYVEGDPFDRGVINGKLSSELVVKQEDNFNEQINKIVTSNSYRHFLRYFIGWFNRNLDENVSDEYKQEINGISKSASDKYLFIGSNYQRILNYHAAHDIGHALQNMMLVGCTSFGTWGAASEDSTMIIGRNFDFYAGDKFGEDKIVAFERPSKGYPFMSVTWGGFIGVVSGMNMKGLAVTINAAKSDIPSGAATPVSLVAREILQYAANIDEAISIARSRKMFVSESFLVSSAADNKAVIIEKTPQDLDVYDPRQDHIICTNQFQSKGLVASKDNQEQIKESASPYRYQRVKQLMEANGKNSVQKTVNLLRDRNGLDGADIGLGNEKAVNQLIAHHSIVFEPQKLLVWVSTGPWQLGPYVAYDLKKIFAMRGLSADDEIMDSALNIAPDPFLRSEAYHDFERFRNFKKRIADGQEVNTDSLVQSNPQFYHAYVLAGDYAFDHKNYKQALSYYSSAATKEIATTKEAEHIRKGIEKSRKQLSQ